jgi:hypothetical protein
MTFSVTSPAPPDVGGAAFVLTAQHELMLRAALTHGASARAAWRAWARNADVENLDPDSQWVMPLLYANLRAEGVVHPVLVRCRNVYLHNWYKGHAVLHALAAWWRAVDGSTAGLVLLRSAATALRSYATVGARPIESVDLWRPTPASGNPPADLTLPDPFPCPLRLHARMLDDAVDVEIGRRAEPVAVMGVSCRIMSPADQLVHLCVQRDSWDTRSRLLWMADAVRLLEGPAGIDWPTAWELAARIQRSQAFASALDDLRRLRACVLPP